MNDHRQIDSQQINKMENYQQLKIISDFTLFCLFWLNGKNVVRSLESTKLNSGIFYFTVLIELMDHSTFSPVFHWDCDENVATNYCNCLTVTVWHLPLSYGCSDGVAAQPTLSTTTVCRTPNYYCYLVMMRPCYTTRSCVWDETGTISALLRLFFCIFLFVRPFFFLPSSRSVLQFSVREYRQRNLIRTQGIAVYCAVLTFLFISFFFFTVRWALAMRLVQFLHLWTGGLCVIMYS